jgi:hypothetical protein
MQIAFDFIPSPALRAGASTAYAGPEISSPWAALKADGRLSWTTQAGGTVVDIGTTASDATYVGFPIPAKGTVVVVK